MQIRDLSDILARPERLLTVIRAELDDIKDEVRRRAPHARSSQDHSDLTIEDLIEPQDVVVTLSHGGYAKAQPVTDVPGAAARRPRQGRDRDQGRGLHRQAVRRQHARHAAVLLQRRQVYWLKVYQLPQASRGSRGKPIVNLLPLQEGERINAVLPIREFDENKFVFMATAHGTVKKTPLRAFSRPRAGRHHRASSSTRATAWSASRSPTAAAQIMLCSSDGKAIRFDENDVRPMGRTAAGVRGIRLPRPAKRSSR